MSGNTWREETCPYRCIYTHVGGDMMRCVRCGHRIHASDKARSNDEPERRKTPTILDNEPSQEEIRNYMGTCKGCKGPSIRVQRENRVVIERCGKTGSDSCPWSRVVWVPDPYMDVKSQLSYDGDYIVGSGRFDRDDADLEVVE